MKIKKIQIMNYRLLKDVQIELEDELSLIIGKNNSGKTSILSILNKFLNFSDKCNFSYYDFNLEFRDELIGVLKLSDEERVKEIESPLGIRLNVFIEYDENDSFANIYNVLMDLDEKNNYLVLGFEYTISSDDISRFRKDYFGVSDSANDADKIDKFLQHNYNKYFTVNRKSLKYSVEDCNIDYSVTPKNLDKEKISLKNIICFKYINANRDVSNKDIDKTLSNQTSKLYKKAESSDDQTKAIIEFKSHLVSTDKDLTDIYNRIFESIIGKVKEFGGVKSEESLIEIMSTLQHKELLEGNTTVMYKHHDHILPEHYNGLGYMNLISMIFEIEILMNEFRRRKEEIPADINLLFIEEPEAHTHPQMQYVFINNIKNLLKSGIQREDGNSRSLQYIISTHSSHIIADSDFNDIKYLSKENKNSVVSKNLRDLEYSYKTEKKNYFKFLKQYLTLNRAEMFFADKIILIEGDTERILIPAMMKKIDYIYPKNPLLSQNISIVEVGAYSQIFEKFINFIGVKTLIITDIDSAEKKMNKEGVLKDCACTVECSSATISTNSSLKFFFNSDDLASLICKLKDDKLLVKDKDTQKWKNDPSGNLLIVYQTNEKNEDSVEYHARSFEDSFFHINKSFMIETDNIFSSITAKHLKKYKANEIDAYEFALKGVGSKPSLAIEILINSKKNDKNQEFSNWNIPEYITEGLLWLKQD